MNGCVINEVWVSWAENVDMLRTWSLLLVASYQPFVFKAQYIEIDQAGKISTWVMGEKFECFPWHFHWLEIYSGLRRDSQKSCTRWYKFKFRGDCKKRFQARQSSCKSATHEVMCDYMIYKACQTLIAIQKFMEEFSKLCKILHWNFTLNKDSIPYALKIL